MSISLDPPLDTEFDTALAAGCTALGTDVLVAIATGLAEVSTPWDLRPGDAPDARHYERILATETYDAWLIFWPASARLDLHDHGGSAGALAVVDGALDETTLVDAGRVEHRLTRGGVASFGPSRIHGVANNTEFPATSVHVYSPPISAMRYYVQADDGGIDEVFDDAVWGSIA